MKKVFFIVGTVLVLLGVVAFIVYEVLPEKETTEVVVVEADPVDGMNVERVTALDKEYMALNYSEYPSYKWFETCILMDDWLDADVYPEVFGVANVFQVQKKVGKNTRVQVILTSHNAVKDTVDVRNGFWVEDYDLTNVNIELTFEQAYDILKRANVKKPHSKHVVLRKAIGPHPYDTYNAQYIFGNATLHYYIDAVTGELNTVDPSGIPEDGGDKPYISCINNE